MFEEADLIHGTRRASLTCSSTTAGNCPRAGWRITTSSPSTTMGAAMSRPASLSPLAKDTGCTSKAKAPVPGQSKHAPHAVSLRCQPPTMRPMASSSRVA